MKTMIDNYSETHGEGQNDHKGVSNESPNEMNIRRNKKNRKIVKKKINGKLLFIYLKKSTAGYLI